MELPHSGHLNNQLYRKNVLAISVASIIGLPGLAIANTEITAMETYVVTGEKFDKDIKEVTTGVTVVTEDRLESGENNQAKDTATLAPNVVASSFSNISIRGISGGGAATGGLAYLTGARARVATVVDGVTQGFSGYNFNPITLWDVEQLEVLRGPQSTAQGSSAIGGALVVNTKDPTYLSEAAVRGGFENYENGNMKYNLGVMSSGALIEDELAYRIVIDGSTGEGWLNYDTNGFDTPNLSESDSVNVRGKLLWEPANIPDLTAKMTVNYQSNSGEHANFVSNTDEGIANKKMTLGGRSEVRIQDSKAGSIAVDLDYRINNGLTNSLLVSYVGSDIHEDAYSTGNTYDIDNKNYVVENRVLFDEVGADLTGVIGLYFSNKDATLLTSNFDLATEYETQTNAIYGEGTYSLSDKLRLVAGLRIENEDSDKTSSTAFSGGESSQDNSDTYYLPKLSVLYDIVSSTTIAATASKGYSPAGVGIDFFGNEYSYDSETVSSFELSSKSVFADSTILNANVFYNDYKDYQAAGAAFDVVNIDQSHTYGLELEGVTWIGEHLELRGTLGLLETNIDEDTTYKGKDLSDAPSSNIGFGFTQYLGESWAIGADAVYVGEYYSDLANTKDSTAGDYTLVDARASYTVGEFSVNAYIKNLTDESAVYYRAGSLAAVSQSRTIGLNVLYRM